MNNDLIFIRHAQTNVDKSVNIIDWDLTEKGYEDSENVKDIPEMQDADILISSNEKKAYLTIKPLADKLGKDIIQIKELGEIFRGDAGGSMTKEEYDEMKRKIFADFDFSDHNWETVNHALARFRTAVEDIDNKYEGKKILISAHGTVLSLYFCYLLDKMDELMVRWKGLGFCDLGIVKDGKGVRDIVRTDTSQLSL